MENKSIVLKGKKIEYILYRKKVKNLNLRIKSDCSILVSAKKEISQKDIDEFLLKNADFIFKALNKFKNMQKILFNYNDGDKLYLFGEQKILRLIKGGNSVKVLGEEVILSVKDIADLALKKRGIDALYKAKTEQILPKMIMDFYTVFKKEYYVSYPKIIIKKLTSVWGNCRKQKSEIHFSTMLAKADFECVNYVIAHEFCHLIEDNHSARFYNVVAKFIPNYKQLKKRLKTYN